MVCYAAAGKGQSVVPICSDCPSLPKQTHENSKFSSSGIIVIESSSPEKMNAAASAPPLLGQVTEAAATPHHHQATPASSSFWSPTDTPVRPPPTVQHPLHLLEEFLGSLPEEGGDADENIGQEANQEEDQPAALALARRSRAAAREEAARARRILRVADFLYGASGSARTVLDNALELLDGGYGAVRCYRARPSGRVAYVVRGSRSGTFAGGAGGGGGGGNGARSGDYLCFLHEMVGCSRSNNHNGGDGAGCGRGEGSSSSSSGGGGGCFCPCRSFFERTKADRRAVCKHLLAARLGPYLKVGYDEYEVSDVQFAHLVLQHSFLAGG